MPKMGKKCSKVQKEAKNDQKWRKKDGKSAELSAPLFYII
jgi:hypothetical protein